MHIPRLKSPKNVFQTTITTRMKHYHQDSGFLDRYELFLAFGGLILQQTDFICSYYVPLLTDLFLFSYEAEFIKNLLKNKTNRIFFHFDLKWCVVLPKNVSS